MLQIYQTMRGSSVHSPLQIFLEIYDRIKIWTLTGSFLYVDLLFLKLYVDFGS